MGKQDKKKRLSVERRQKICFSWFVMSLFLLAVSNTAAAAHPMANWLSIVFAMSAAISLYRSYILTP